MAVAGRVAAESRGGRLSTAWLGTLLLLGTGLADAISEVHFLLAALATTLLHLTALPPRRWIAYAPGLTVLGLPAAYPDVLLGARPDAQNLLVVGELALLVGACLPASLKPRRFGVVAPVPD